MPVSETLFFSFYLEVKLRFPSGLFLIYLLSKKTCYFCINMQYGEWVVKGIKLRSESMGFRS